MHRPEMDRESGGETEAERLAAEIGDLYAELQNAESEREAAEAEWDRLSDAMDRAIRADCLLPFGEEAAEIIAILCESYTDSVPIAVRNRAEGEPGDGWRDKLAAWLKGQGGGLGPWPKTLCDAIGRRLAAASKAEAFYPTGPGVAEIFGRVMAHRMGLCDRSVRGRTVRILEPCAGRGDLLRGFIWGLRGEIRRTLYDGPIPRIKVTAVELVPGHRSELEQLGTELGIKLGAPLGDVVEVVIGDIRAVAPRLGFYDLIITNPPFGVWEDVWRAVRPCMRRGGHLALLLRQAFFESRSRHGFHKAHPSDCWLIDERPSFVASGKTDKWGIGWFLWDDQVGERGSWTPMSLDDATLPTSASAEPEGGEEELKEEGAGGMMSEVPWLKGPEALSFLEEE